MREKSEKKKAPKKERKEKKERKSARKEKKNEKAKNKKKYREEWGHKSFLGFHPMDVSGELVQNASHLAGEKFQVLFHLFPVFLELVLLPIIWQKKTKPKQKTVGAFFRKKEEENKEIERERRGERHKEKRKKRK